MPFDTRITGLSIHELLRIISNSSLSGVLTVITAENAGRIIFTWGRVTHAATDRQERIGEMLIRKKIITEKDLSVALGAQATYRRPRPLGVIIASLGYTDAATIGKLLREQMKGAFFEIMSWTDGTAELEFDGAVTLASVRLDVSLDTPTLLLEAARRRDEAGGAARGIVLLPVADEPTPSEVADAVTDDGSAAIPPELVSPLSFDESPFEEWQILSSPLVPPLPPAARPDPGEDGATQSEGSSNPPVPA